MKLLIDTADDTYISVYKDVIEGVTSNPIILRKNDIKPLDFVNRYTKMFTHVFLQIAKEDDIIEEIDHNRLIYKVPLHLSYFKLIRNIINEGYDVCGTTTYDVIQFNQACDLGCKYCIVLCSKNDDERFLQKCIQIKENYKYDIKIIAASFRTKKDVEYAAIGGADFATIPPTVMDLCFNNNNLEADLKDYGN